MNGFYGIFNPDGVSADFSSFEGIRAGLNERGFRSGETFHDFYFIANHFSKVLPSEQLTDSGPTQSCDGQFILVGYFRLDYRDELGDKLGVHQNELVQTSDAHLILKAYGKWGSGCVHHLEGDWAFVLFDKRRKTVLMAKDPSGCSALFYRFENGRMFFSSDATVLIDAGDLKANVDELQLLRTSVPFLKIESSKTLISNLIYLKSAHAIQFNGISWTFPYAFHDLTIGKKTSYRFEGDAAFAHFSCLQLATLQRVRSSSSIGVMLSSGKDSMAVASLSSLALEIAGSRLKTYTSFPHYREDFNFKEKEYADESELVRKFAARRKNVDASFDDFGIYKLSQTATNDYLNGPFQPVIHLNEFWIRGLMELAFNEGVCLMLTGQMGNFTISGDGYFVHADLFRKFAWKTLFLDLRALCKLKGRTLWSVFRNRVIVVLWYQVKTFFLFKSLYSKQFWKKYSYLNPHFVETLSKKITKSRHEHIGGYYWVRSGQSLRKELIDQHLCHAGMLWYGYGVAFGMYVSDPTADNRLITHSFEIGDSWFYRGGIVKWLYSQMMRNIVDKEILESRLNKVQSHDFGLRIVADIELLQKIDSFKEFPDLAHYFNLIQLKKMHNEIITDAKPQFKKNLIFQFLQCFSVINYVFSQKKLILNKKKQSNVQD